MNEISYYCKRKEQEEGQQKLGMQRLADDMKVLKDSDTIK